MKNNYEDPKTFLVGLKISTYNNMKLNYDKSIKGI